MPVKVIGPDGAEYQFPDGTDKAAAIAYFKKKGVGAAQPKETPITPPSFYERFSKPTSKEAKAAHPIQANLSDIGRGAISGVGTMIQHPIQTLSGSTQNLGDLLTAALPNAEPPENVKASKERLKSQWEAAKENPAFTVGQLLGGAALGKGIGKVVEVAPKIVGRAAEGLTDTGPKVTRNLVKDTAKINEAEGAKTAKATANEAERGRLQTIVGEGSKELQGRIETAREAALKVGNEKYNAINEKLNPLPADMEKIHNAYQEASSSISDVQSEPPLLKRLGESIQRGDALTYKDEQALYSELGKELSKGTLPGTTYHAYDMLHDIIGEDMQRMADSQDMGGQLTEARAYWKRMKQTFGRPASVRDAATRTLRTLAPEATKRGELENRVRLLSHYDPAIEHTAQTVTNAREGVKALPKLKPGEKPQTIGTKDIQAAKAEGLAKRADWIQHRGAWAATWPVLYALKDVIQGNAAGIPGALGEGAAVYGAVRGVAEILRNPKVVEFLTKATPRDIAEVPPDLRSDLPAIVAQARKSGIAVSPALGALGATAPKKRVAAALSTQ